MKKRTGIIPYRTTLYETSSGRIIPREEWTTYPGTLDLPEICIFAACGFFLGDASYYQELKAIPPASEFEEENGVVSNIQTYFRWTYQPRDVSLQQATEEFTKIFHQVIQKGVHGKNVILPLSGGLDSRSLAAALKNHSSLYSYSYGYKNGIGEINFSKQIAQAENFKFNGFEIGDNYLWGKIDQLSDILQNYSEFTHPRQMAVYDALKGKGNLFVLGHWGDVLFDGMGMKAHATFDEMVDALYKKVLKKAERNWVKPFGTNGIWTALFPIICGIACLLFWQKLKLKTPTLAFVRSNPCIGPRVGPTPTCIFLKAFHPFLSPISKTNFANSLPPFQKNG